MPLQSRLASQRTVHEAVVLEAPFSEDLSFEAVNAAFASTAELLIQSKRPRWPRSQTPKCFYEMHRTTRKSGANLSSPAHCIWLVQVKGRWSTGQHPPPQRGHSAFSALHRLCTPSVN